MTFDEFRSSRTLYLTCFLGGPLLAVIILGLMSGTWPLWLLTMGVLAAVGFEIGRYVKRKYG